MTLLAALVFPVGWASAQAAAAAALVAPRRLAVLLGEPCSQFQLSLLSSLSISSNHQNKSTYIKIIEWWIMTDHPSPSRCGLTPADLCDKNTNEKGRTAAGAGAEICHFGLWDYLCSLAESVLQNKSPQQPVFKSTHEFVKPFLLSSSTTLHWKRL